MGFAWISRMQQEKAQGTTSESKTQEAMHPFHHTLESQPATM